MAIVYQEASQKDISRLLNFRWARAYEHGDYARQDLRPFKKDFRFFLNDELNKTHRCYYVSENDEILGTIYWSVQKGFKVSGQEGEFAAAALKYFESVPKLETAVFEKLLDKVIESCKEEDVLVLCSLYHKENADVLLRHGFCKEGDVLKLILK